MEKLWVISLGGSRIIPDSVDYEFLEKFKKLVISHKNKKFVVVTGGGTTARKYISAFKELGKRVKAQNKTGIAITRFHAGFMAKYFGKRANEQVPTNMKKVKNLLSKNQIVFCGGLRYGDHNTSDGTAAQLAAYLDSSFINLTNVKGLYTSDPRKNKSAKLIKKITWKKFNDIVKKIKYKAGQHFVLDQKGAKIIKKEKIPTYIVGSLTSMNKIIKGKDNFVGTRIEG